MPALKIAWVTCSFKWKLEAVWLENNLKHLERRADFLSLEGIEMMKILECHSPLPDKTIALSYKHKQWIQSMEEVKMSGGDSIRYISATQLVTAISQILRWYSFNDWDNFPAQAMCLSVYYLTNINLFIVFSIFEL